MKSDLQIKFLSFITGRKKGEGFTLIELLVVIIIIGILAAIALPSFLNQANKAKQSEAKQYVGALVRSQQAFFLENAEFAANVEDLGKVVAADTTNYTYSMTSVDAKKDVTVNGITKNATTLKSYFGGVVINTVGGSGESKDDATTAATVCETVGPSATKVVPVPGGADAATRCPLAKELGAPRTAAKKA